MGYFVLKITILRQKIIFFSIAEGGAKQIFFWGGGAPVAALGIDLEIAIKRRYLI